MSDPVSVAAERVRAALMLKTGAAIDLDAARFVAEHAIHALREPSPEMVEAGQAAARGDNGRSIGRSRMWLAGRAMIDAALAESPPR